MPLLQRKEILKSILPDSDIIKYCDHVEGEGKAFHREMKKANMEGIIAKRADSIYQIRERSPNWLKLKNVNSDEAVIVGFTDPKNSRKGFGSLLLASNKKGKLTYIGNVGTGFTDKSLSELSVKLKKIERSTSALDAPIKKEKDMHWVDPIYVCNIKYSEITEEGNIRHPVFLGLRVDKSPSEIKLP